MGVVSGVISSTEKVGRIGTFLFIFSYSVYHSVVYDLVKIKLSESEGEGEEPTNYKSQNRALGLVNSSASACYSDNAVFTT